MEIEKKTEEENDYKCRKCFALQRDDKGEEMCIAPVCIEENIYDPENRTWTKKPLIEEGLIGNIEERSFGYEDKIKYILNRRTGDLYFSRFKEPISITLLKAIIRNADPKKQNKFESLLRERLNKEWEYRKVPLWAGKTNPNTGKKENLHTLIPKNLWNASDLKIAKKSLSQLLSKVEIIEDNGN